MSRLLRLRFDYGDGWGVDVELLRPLSWFAEDGVVEGGTLHLHMEEMGVVGDGLVLGIDPCPEVEAGPGRVVTGVFRHWRGEVYELRVEGEPAAIVVTREHPFWSMDRNAWTPACALRAGERLQAQDGRTPRVLSFKPRDGVEPVYNIEVEEPWL